MKNPIRTTALTLSLPTGIIVLALSISQAMSPRSAGRQYAEALQIPYPAVIAHRGLSYWAPEETKAAFLLAREIGADYLEADIQRTKDGVLIALHDDTLERTTNAYELFPERKGKGPEAFTWAEIQKLDAGSWFNKANPDRARPSYAGLKILRLEEMIDIAESGTNRPGIYLETKEAHRFPGYEKEIVALLRERGWIDGQPDARRRSPGERLGVNVADGRARVIFQSFVPESLARLRELAPDVPRLLLIDREDLKKESWSYFVARAKALGAGIGPSGYEGFPQFTGPVHRAGLFAHHYTVNAKWQIHLLRFFGSDGLFTDAADRVLEAFGRGPVDLAGAFQKTGF